jgi:hypothetical protein
MRASSRTKVTAGLLVLGVAAVIIGIVYIASPREPVYQGKTLSEWIAPFCRQTAKGLDAPGGPEHFEELEPVRQAVRQIGTNGVPFLIARLNHRESGLHREARQLSEKQPYASLRLTDPNVSKIRAIRALANLASEARPAIPSLKAQLTDTTLSQHAVYALSGMGAEGMQALVDQYTNIPVPLRTEAALVIVSPGSMYRGGPATLISSAKKADKVQTNQIPADILIQGLSQIVKDTTSPFQTFAIERLGRYGPLASNAVPILIEILNGHNPRALQSTIIALGRIRSQAEVVVPALTNLLSDPELRIRMSAVSALREFGYEVPGVSQVPRVMHPPRAIQREENQFY